MKKKVIFLFVFTLMITTLFTACGSSKKENASEDNKETQTDGSEKVDVSKLYELSEIEKLDLGSIVKFGDYSKVISLKESDYVVTDAEIQKEIAYYTEAYGTKTQIKDRAVADKDTVNIDFVGKMNGEVFEGGSAKGQSLTIGSNTFIPGFEAGLIGVKPGETKTLNLQFPSEYKPNPDLAGKDVAFDVTVNYIEGVVPAEYNDAFVSKVTEEEYKTVDEFNAYIKSYVEAQKRQNVIRTFKDALLKITEFTGDIASYVEEEYQAGLDYYKSYAQMYGCTLAEFAGLCGYASEQELLDGIKRDAETYIKEKFVIYAYADAIGFKMSEDEVKSAAEELVSLYGYGSVETLVSQYGAESVRYDILVDALALKIIETYK